LFLDVIIYGWIIVNTCPSSSDHSMLFEVSLKQLRCVPICDISVLPVDIPLIPGKQVTQNFSLLLSLIVSFVLLFQIDALCMAFYARSEEARQSHSVHKLALVSNIESAYMLASCSSY
jgi:hypothetical protein